MKVQKSDTIDYRFVIVDDAGKVVDDASGYGYKTYKKAIKAMWYKFGGGKAKIETATEKRRKFMKEYPGLENFIEELYMYNCKEFARGEYNDKNVLVAIKDKIGVDMPKAFLHD